MAFLAMKLLRKLVGLIGLGWLAVVKEHGGHTVVVGKIW
jgi:hypothetical protein